jgi:ferritin-like metal-binding protein YciE
MANAQSLKDLFLHNLRRMYDGEQRLAKALPKLRDAAASDELKHAFQVHFEETEAHVDRLATVFTSFGEKVKGTTCDAIKGILDDGKDVVRLDAEPDVKDAALIAAAQEAEHFEIAMYGTLRTWAVVLGSNEALQILEVTLEEEKNTDTLLTGIAATLNLRAAHAD